MVQLLSLKIEWTVEITRRFSHHFLRKFWQITVKRSKHVVKLSNYLVTCIGKTFIWRETCLFFRKTPTAVWKKRKILSHHQKIFRQNNSLVTCLVNRYFHEIFAKNPWERIPVISTLWHHTLWSLRNFCITVFWQIFRENNSQVKPHSVEITGILSHTFLAKISWK